MENGEYSAVPNKPVFYFVMFTTFRHDIMGGGGYFMYVTWGGRGGAGKFAVPHFSVPTHAETMKFCTIVCNQ